MVDKSADPMPVAVVPLVLKLFGPPQVWVEGAPISLVRSRKGLALLALLSLRQGRGIARALIAESLWPDIDPERASANLRPVLSELRKALKGQAYRLESPSRHTLRLNMDEADVDVVRFDAAIAKKTVESLRVAVEQYSGSLLEGWTDEWVESDRIARAHECLEALIFLADAASGAGRYRVAASYLERAFVLDPWQDRTTRQLMEVLTRAGDVNAALNAYRRFVTRLRDDPKAKPDQQTSDLYAYLRAQARDGVGKAAIFRDEEDDPPAPMPIFGDLRHPVTGIVGRQDERIEIADKLRRTRLLTLTGMGGIGKTRLAVEVAKDVAREYADGVWIVALESLQDGRLVAQQIATALRLNEAPDRSPQHLVTDALRGKSALLVLDNCEHLLEGCASVIQQILRSCGGVRVLATSREPLGVKGEAAWPVPALSILEPAYLPPRAAARLRVLMSYESVQLFVDRAQAASRDFALHANNVDAMAQLCVQLAGVPLAIELAAARTRAMTLDQIVNRLDDQLALLQSKRPAALSRHRSMRATLDWSYALLSSQETMFLSRLSVFAGGWIMDAAESVCTGEGVPAGATADLLERLVDKSFVTFDVGRASRRYRMLETVRQYVAERLPEDEEQKLRSKHRDWCLNLAREARPQVNSQDSSEWMERMEAEYANLHAALNWVGGEPEDAAKHLQLVGALSEIWHFRGRYAELQRYVDQALRRDDVDAGGRDYARVLHVSALLAHNRGDLDAAQQANERCFEIYRSLGDQRDAAMVLLGLAYGARNRGQQAEARAMVEECVHIFRELGNASDLGNMLSAAAEVVEVQGDYAAARRLNDESVRLLRNTQNNIALAQALCGAGSVAYALKNSAESVQYYEEALLIFREHGYRSGAATALVGLGNNAFSSGDIESSEGLYDEAISISRDIGSSRELAVALTSGGKSALARGDRAAALACYRESLEIGASKNHREQVVETLQAVAALFSAEQRHEDSVRWLANAHALREQIGVPDAPRGREVVEQLLAMAARCLPPTVYDAAWQAGYTADWRGVACELLRR